MAELSRRVIRQIGSTASPSTSSTSGTQTETRSSCWRSTRDTPSRTPSCSSGSTASPTTTTCCSWHSAANRDRAHREGPYAVAAKWFVRRVADGVVRRVPTAEEIAQVERDIAGCVVDVTVEPGERLSELHDQDSYSYAIANVYIGAGRRGRPGPQVRARRRRAAVRDRRHRGHRTRGTDCMRIVDRTFPHRGHGGRSSGSRWPTESTSPDASGDRRRPDTRPVPAVLEFIPYRQRDLTAVRDSIHHPYLAGHGYAGVRVDLRGSGDSEGVLTDEYLEQELCDAEEVLAWLAAQPWCNGRTGMMGISWGGFNALQVAARRPPGLRAVVAACLHRRPVRRRRALHGRLPADRQPVVGVDDVRLQLLPSGSRGGRRALAGDVARAAGRQRALAGGVAAPPAPRRLLAARFDLRGLLRHHLSRARRQRLGRRLHQLRVPAARRPRRPAQGTRSGPWSHKYPHLGQPGPAVGFLQELVRWWDHWLRDADNDVMDEPMLRIWMQESVPPSTAYEERPGRWVGEPSWPSPQVQPVTHPLGRPPDPSTRRPAEPAPLGASSPCSRRCRWASSPASGAPTTLRPTCPTTSARRTAARWSSTAMRSPSGWRSSAPRSWTSSSPSTSRSRWSRSGSPTSHPTGAPPASATACSTSPTAPATTGPKRSSRASATGSA